MKTLFANLLAVITLGLAPQAFAEDQPVVVELYTSQGCSSCPPADALLQKLAQRSDVIALALHVDYWDYIGWKDIFAMPQFSERQRSYARAAGARSVYTPQMIIGGQTHLMGNKPMDLLDAINRQKALHSPVSVALDRKGPKLNIALGVVGQGEVPRGMVVQLVRFVPNQTVSIKRGENAGRTINYANIVTMWKPVGSWDGRRAKSITVDVGENENPVAVILQAKNYGPVIAAAQLR